MDSYFRARDILDKAMGTDSYFHIKSILFGLKAADVVEVTFCKDCRYYQDAKTNSKGFLICPASGMEITEMDYCSYGALMDGEENPTCHDGVCEIPGIK